VREWMHSAQRTEAVTWRMRQWRESGPRVMRRASTLQAIGNVASLKEMAARSLARASCAGCMRAQWKGALTWSMTARLAPACLQRSAARWTAAVAPEMTIWSGELRLAGETMALLSEKVLASGVEGSGVSWSVTWAQISVMRAAGKPRMAA